MTDDKKTTKQPVDDQLEEKVDDQAKNIAVDKQVNKSENNVAKKATKNSNDSETSEKTAKDADQKLKGSQSVDGQDSPEVPEVPEIQEVTVKSPNLVKISDLNNKKARWYVVHAYSGHEAKVAMMIKQRAETLSLTDKILEILIPTQEKIQIKRGQRKTVSEKIFPGYILVNMEVTDDSWLAVRTTQGVTGFVGIGSKPTALPKHEVEAIRQYMTQAAPQYKADYVEGEAVRITDGPFNDFLATVSSIDEDKGKVEVLVNIFGRETPVSLDFLQVKKV